MRTLNMRLFRLKYRKRGSCLIFNSILGYGSNQYSVIAYYYTSDVDYFPPCSPSIVTTRAIV